MAKSTHGDIAKREIEYLGADLVAEMTSDEIRDLIQDKYGVLIPARTIRYYRQQVLEKAGKRLRKRRQGTAFTDQDD